MLDIAHFWTITKQTMPYLVDGMIATTVLSLLSILFGSALGMVIGFGRALGPRWLNLALGGYIHLLRGTPFLVQIYIIYFLLPETGFRVLELSSWSAAIIALSMYTSTYVGEIVRGAIESVPTGQVEAARASGLTTGQSLRYVILPQALRLILPPMGGVYVIVIKGTSVLSVIGVSELVHEAQTLTLRFPADIMIIFLLVAVMYGIYCYPVLRLTRWAEQRWGTVTV